MECKKHPLRKRKDCPQCQGETSSSSEQIEPIRVALVPNKEPVVTKSLKDVVAAKKSKVVEAPTIIEFTKPENEAVELNKALKDEIIEFIRKEVKKTVALVTEELISEEARASAKRVANEAMDKAIESYRFRVKELSEVKYENIAIPLNQFRVAMMDKLTNEGWKMGQTFTGEVAKVSLFKTDVVIFTRVMNDKWPKAPEFK